MKAMKKISDWLDKFGEVWSLGIVLLVVMPFYEAVVDRWILNEPTSWSQELCCMLFGVWFMVGGAYCEAMKGHVAMDLFYEKFKGVTKIVADTIIFVSVSVVLLYLLKDSINDVIICIRDQTRSSSFWNPVVWPYRIFIPFGVIMYYIRYLYNYLCGLQLAAKQIRDRNAQ